MEQELDKIIEKENQPPQAQGNGLSALSQKFNFSQPDHKAEDKSKLMSKFNFVETKPKSIMMKKSPVNVKQNIFVGEPILQPRKKKAATVSF